MPSREAFRIGPFQIGNFTIDIPVYWYGIMIMLGVLVASFIAYQEAKRRGEDPEHVWQLFPWVLIAGIIGARIGFLLPNLGDPRYSQNIMNIIDIRQGGLSIQGAVIGGAIAVIIYCRRAGLSFYKWGDIIVPGLALAQAIGRWGNYFNQEAFGQPTTLPWGIPILVQRQREVAGQEFGPDTRFHPTFAYEMVWDLLNFGLLMWLGRQKRFRLLEGDLIWFYIIFYSVGRFLIESIRVDSAMVGGIPAPQIIAIASIVLAWTMIIYRHRPGSNAKPSEANLPDGYVALEEAGSQKSEIRSQKSEGGSQKSRMRKVPVTASATRSENVGVESSATGGGNPGAATPEPTPEG